MRTPIALLLVAAVVGGLWLFQRHESPPGPVEAATSTSTEAPEPRGADPVSPPANAVARTDVGGETPVEGPNISVLVVTADTEAPVAGAVVRYADPEFDWRALPSARRNELGMLQSSDPEAFLEQTGGRTRTGPDGRCRVPARAGGTVQVCAREGGLFGFAHGTEGEVTEILVALARDQSLRVRLVDAAGEPLADQSVALEPLDENGEAMRSPVPPQRTDDEGRCLFRHLQRLAGNRTEAPAQVRAQFVGGGGPTRAFDLVDLPDEEVVLVAEPMGAITVRLLERDGRPVDPALLGDAQVNLAAFAEPPSEPERRGERIDSQSRVLAEGGSVRIAPVVFDRHFKINSFLDDARTFAGPTAQNPEVAIDLRQADRGATVTGRILTKEGPLVTEGFEVQITGEERSDTRFGHTAEDGSFRLPFDTSMATGPVTLTVRRGLIWTRDDLDAPSEREFTLASLPPGANDIGDVTLVPLPIVASGQLTGAVPEFPQIRIELAKKVGDRWRRETGFDFDWDGEGGFELRAAIAPGTPIRLSPKPMDSLPVEPIEVPAGTTGIEIELVAGGEATAWFVTDENTPVDLFRIAIAPQEQADSTDRDWRANQLTIHSEKGFGIPWRGLTPGPHRLTVTSPVSQRPLLEITDLEIPSGGACEDPRLKDIDLRQLLTLAEVRFQGADGAPMAFRDAFVVITADERDWPAIPIVDGIARVPIADAAVPILAIVPGYLAVETTVDRSGATLSLARSPAIAVRAMLPTPIPDDVDFELRLVPTDERFRSARVTIPRGLDIPAGSGPADDRFAVSAAPGADGVAMLHPLLDATHTVVARVGRTTVRDESGSCDVSPGAREVTFRAHPERLAEAIADR